MNGVVQQLRQGAILGDPAELTDGQLLGLYVDQHDEAAFAVLVRRHAGMVWGVCRRVLGDHHEVEDAFQATFLVLVRKAGSVKPRDLAGNWLYGVAYHIALKARALAGRRRVRERQVAAMPESSAVQHDHWHDLQPLLDQELSKLSDKYRTAVVLCDLEGKSYREAAQQLGCPEGTLAAWLSRARTLLAGRLSRRGVTLSAVALGAALAQSAALAAPPAVVSKTIKAASLFAAGHGAAQGVISAQAVQLTEGMVRTMFLKRLSRWALMLVGVAVLLAGAGYLYAALKTGDAEQTVKPANPALVPQEKKSDAQRIVGTWRFVEMQGAKMNPDETKVLKALARITFTKDGKVSMTIVEDAKEGTYKIVGPGKIDMVIAPSMEQGLAIYKFDGDDKLTICAPNNQGAPERPKDFTAGEGSGQFVLILERAKAGEEKATAEELAKYKDQAKQIRNSAAMTQCANNFRQIGLAFYAYASTYKHLPLHAIYSKDGKKALLSWRVALLPYLEQGELYKEFKLDEPWDSEHNKKLIAKMPAYYAILAGKDEEGKTYIQVFTGPGTVFDGDKKITIEDIQEGNGAPNVILAIEGKQPVIWTKPDDLVVPKEKDKMPEVGGQFKEIVTVLMCDGSVQRMPASVDAKDLRESVMKGTKK
jgi:RNA polymerase sigma factor (sigma-70 family)